MKKRKLLEQRQMLDAATHQAEAVLARFEAVLADYSDPNRQLRVRIRRHTDDNPETLDEFHCWVATYTDGHQEFLWPMATRPDGLKDQAAIAVTAGSDAASLEVGHWKRQKPKQSTHPPDLRKTRHRMAKRKRKATAKRKR